MEGKRVLILAIAGTLAAGAIGTGVARQAGAATTASPSLSAAQIAEFSALDSNLTSAVPAPTDPPGHFNSVQAMNYDPGDTDSVQSKWEQGIGCPNGTATKSSSNYTDPTCATMFDPMDEENDGLLLEKGGPTGQNSAATAQLQNVQGITLTELGYDIRLLDYPSAGQGSHCGAGAPRFDVYTTAGLFFVGCDSPPATSVTLDSGTGSGGAWTRLRWSPVMGFGSACGPSFGPCAVTGTVQHIYIVFDEGTDTGPDFFGTAVLDNIDVNGQLVGKG